MKREELINGRPMNAYEFYKYKTKHDLKENCGVRLTSEELFTIMNQFVAHCMSNLASHPEPDTNTPFFGNSGVKIPMKEEGYSKIPCPRCGKSDSFSVIKWHHKCRVCGVRYCTDVAGNRVNYATLDWRMEEQEQPVQSAEEIAEKLTKQHSDFNKEGFSEYFNGYFNGIIKGVEYSSQKHHVTDEEIREYCKQFKPKSQQPNLRMAIQWIRDQMTGNKVTK